MQAFACCVAAHPLAVSSICVARRRSDIKLPSEMNPSPPGADELSATIRAYSSGEQSLVRTRMFGEMAGMLRAPHDPQGGRKPWPERKTDFFLFALHRLASSAKDESAASKKDHKGNNQQGSEGLSPTKAREIELKGGHGTRRGSLAHRAPHGGDRAGGAFAATSNLWTSAPSSGVKEILCKEDVTISVGAVQAVVDAVVLDKTGTVTVGSPTVQRAALQAAHPAVASARQATGTNAGVAGSPPTRPSSVSRTPVPSPTPTPSAPSSCSPSGTARSTDATSTPSFRATSTASSATSKPRLLPW